jgi:hypothetical protein
MTTLESLTRDARSAARYSPSGVGTSVLNYAGGQQISVGYDAQSDSLVYRCNGRPVDESFARVALLDLEQRYRG